MLNPPRPGAYNSATTLHNHAEVSMPHYEFFCHACKKTFSKILTIAEHEKGKNVCPHCGSKNVEQGWSAFSAITAKKRLIHSLKEAPMQFDNFCFGSIQ